MTVTARTKTVLGVAAAAAVLAAPRVAAHRWSANPDLTDGAPLVLPEGEDRTVTTGDGARLAVRICGDPTSPTVVLIHGWTAEKRIWGPVARRLVKDGRRVVVYDQRAHGSSTAGIDGLTVAAIGDDVDSVLRTLDLRDVVLAGHSMGGMAVQSFASRHKDVLAERVASMVLVSTASSSVSLGPAFTRVAGAVVGSPRVDAAMRRPTLGPLLVRGSVGRKASMTHLLATRESFLATAPDTRRDFLEQMAIMDLRPELAGIHTPTVVVSGTRDTLLAHKLSKRLAASIPGATLVAIPGAGHQLPFEAPDRLAQILYDAGQAGSAGPVSRTEGSLP
ncbi:alpha/beta hydrolase [Acidiferrimicrobium sp. IK]|uniref:alpha/beta fold hydrolase n=1 Tax=Acidiferrimicrobium sp. IK TaxID=2871700 RepID=UPI0021CB90F7|nr:alpha/beta hydrolase [Acidiferrimicrobium sp. IK]MCU4184750.1 alpha/beta hydrolase [Acidiferrimicrobium sp. IK]